MTRRPLSFLQSAFPPFFCYSPPIFLSSNFLFPSFRKERGSDPPRDRNGARATLAAPEKRQEIFAIIEFSEQLRGSLAQEDAGVGDAARAAEQEQAAFKDGQIFSIYTPQFAPDAAAQLARVLNEAN